jgi:hypothetical protein
MCLPLIHAAAFEPSIKNVTLAGSLVSYRSIVMNRIYKVGLIPTGSKGYEHPYELNFSWGIAGVLKAYDLPDLIGCIAPRKVVMIDPKDQTLESASQDLVEQEMTFPHSVYSGKGVSDNLKITSSVESFVELVNWCFKK